MDVFDIVKSELLKKEDTFVEYATKSKDAIRLFQKEEDIRPAFFHDTDVIIHSNSYARYMGKTQVYSFLKDDHISKRMLHVQLVSKIARTIGRCLNLNEDLIEAIGLGHDIGHTPLGHTGEKFLNEISLKELGCPFMHNLQSVRTYMYIENHGKGCNLTIQVLDGIMCHNGEKLERVYRPKPKTKEEFLNDFEEASKSATYASSLNSMTLEGCIVRISDVIAYIGRDIEDAITLNKLDRKDIPLSITSVLGNSNREIVNNIVLDIIKNSYGKNEIVLSEEVFNAVNDLLKFNYENIYNYANNSNSLTYYKESVNKLFYSLLEDLEKNNDKSKVYKNFLYDKDSNYLKNTNNKKIVIDYIAGMTDEYFIKQLEDIC